MYIPKWARPRENLYRRLREQGYTIAAVKGELMKDHKALTKARNELNHEQELRRIALDLLSMGHPREVIRANFGPNCLNKRKHYQSL